MGKTIEKAVTFREQGQYEKGVKVAKKALKVAEKTFGPDHPYVATSLNGLGLLYYSQGK